MWTLRAFDPATDRGAVESLWRKAMRPWPVLPVGLDGLTTGIAAVDPAGELVGLVAIGVRSTVGGVRLIMVAPEHRRRGMGTALLAAASRELAAAGATEVDAGGPGRIWPGVPLDLPAAVAFFTARGWRSPHDCADLTQDLRDYRDPPGSTAGCVTAEAPPGVCDAEIAAFEAEHFPSWSGSFATYLADPALEVLTARDEDGALIGTLLFAGPGVTHPFRPLLGAELGTIGCVGVAATAQGRGVGSAMVAHASRVLRDRGVHTCLVDWVVREAFYGRLGYRPWRRYRMFRAPGPSTG